MLSGGSSPRGRGTPPVCRRAIPLRRFIPAWAGHTYKALASSHSAPVHPRVGGAHVGRARLHEAHTGSSPRGRGTLSRSRCIRSAPRFIPAWAGHTILSGCGIGAPSVHPRVGGAHKSASSATSSEIGSSPRGRGTRSRPISWRISRRFIPAWAGHTRLQAARAAALTVHPRVGGAHLAPKIVPYRGGGSSPRGRGTQLPWKHYAGQVRFIPAWAGHTVSIDCDDRVFPVHPRVGGAHLMGRYRSSSEVGSSPRGRGTHELEFPIDPYVRFIPAWAGHTRSVLLQRSI